MTITKIIKYIIVVWTIPFISCKGQTQRNSQEQQTKDPIVTIQENEQKSSEKKLENNGASIAIISFQVKTDNKKDFEDGVVPWASIENAKQDVLNLYKKDEIVIKEHSVKIIIDYPLTNQYEFTITSGNGFTRQQLLTEISHQYFKLYEEEEKSATVKTIPIDKRTTMYNRNQTDGKYGIWGHDIADLVLSEAQVFKTTDGQIIVTLSIES